MSEIRRIGGFSFNVRGEEIRRILGYGPAAIPPRVRTLLGWAEETGEDLVAPICAYRLLERYQFAPSEYLRDLDHVAVCIVTIGERLEQEVDRLKKIGKLTEALLLDTYGSAAAEACADTAEKLLSSEVLTMGLKCSRRFSPGYGGWNVAEQRWILDALDAESVGVKLTEGCMMVPRKSITFAVVIGENPAEMVDARECESCDLPHCRFKRILDDWEKGEK